MCSVCVMCIVEKYIGSARRAAAKKQNKKPTNERIYICIGFILFFFCSQVFISFFYALHIQLIALLVHSNSLYSTRTYGECAFFLYIYIRFSPIFDMRSFGAACARACTHQLASKNCFNSCVRFCIDFE